MSPVTSETSRNFDVLNSGAIQSQTIIALCPVDSPFNRYVDLFAKALADQQFAIRQFGWHPGILKKTDIAIIHWPDEFFTTHGTAAALKSVLKIAMMRLSKRLWSTRFVWVAHNAGPHDPKQSVRQLTQWFLRSLDGIIFLSAYSRDLICELYPESREPQSLVTVHGHYRDAAVTPLTANPVPSGDVKLAYIGLIRPYKNLEILIETAAKVSGLELLISGMAFDRSLGDALLARSGQCPHITFDLWDAPINDAKFEAIVDSADAIVLPYRNILNSGAALFALSRNRPVLAPRIGSLPELRVGVGADWLYLYDGDFNEEVLINFIDWMHQTKRSQKAPLDSYSWSRIGRDLGKFIESLRNGGLVH
jgi:beta-1,4-mannosyltransferase